MKTLVAVALFSTFILDCLSNQRTHKAPMVRVYSRNPGWMDKENVLLCHATNFHPPEITIELLRNGEELKDAVQSDLAFEDDWHFNLIKHANFTPRAGETFACRVKHDGKTSLHSWEPDE